MWACSVFQWVDGDPVELRLCFPSDSSASIDLLKNDFDLADAAAALRRAAERGIDTAYSRTRRATRNGGFNLGVAEPIAGAGDHDALLLEHADEDREALRAYLYRRRLGGIVAASAKAHRLNNGPRLNASPLLQIRFAS